MSTRILDRPACARARAGRGWAIVGALSVTETVSWGVLYYAFAVFLVPMQADLGLSAAQLTGAFSAGLLVSGIAGIAVGRHLDRRSPRGLMTAGSLGGAVLVLAWSRVETLPAFYALWTGIGLVMAAVLYEPAFTVLAKWFPDPPQRRRAMTVLTLFGALAGFVFLPLSQALVDAYGWRDALVVLAVILAVVTVPLHAVVLRAPPGHAAQPERSAGPAAALRSSSFRQLSGAFVLGSIATIAMTVHAIPFLVEHGHSPAFAAFAVGLVGAAQIPGRLLYGPLAARLPPPAATAGVFATIAAGIALTVLAPQARGVLAGLALLGMGNGMATLARATAIADLYGTGAYGTIAAVAAAMTTAARALGPVAAALVAAATGYTGLLWILAGLAATAAVLAFNAQTAERPAPARSSPARAR